MKIDNIEFIFEGLPKHLEGMTFEELFKVVARENHKLLERLCDETGDNIFTPEFDSKLTDEERWYLNMAHAFREISRSAGRTYHEIP